jgi:hypothetical protein
MLGGPVILRTLAWAILLAAVGMHIAVLIRVTPFRRELDERKGLTRFIEFISRPWNENYSPTNYSEEGQGLVPWVRWTGYAVGLSLLFMFLSLLPL